MKDPKPVLVDTHCHLDAPQFEEDLSQILTRARAAGVHRFVVPATDLSSSREVVKMAEQYDQIYAAIGVHPHNARSWSESDLAILSDLAQSPRVVAIGEIGLDYYRNYSPKASQRLAFAEQLEFAAQAGLPVIVHNRQASDEIITILRDWALGLSGSLDGRCGVLHAFSGVASMAKEAIAAGFYLGFAGPVTYPKAEMLRALVSRLPLDRALIETDSPYLPPHPHRGMRNEPSFVRLIAVQLAEIHNMDVSRIGLTTSKNASILFGWKHGNEDSVLF